jgi:hypothetical protein
MSTPAAATPSASTPAAAESTPAAGAAGAAATPAAGAPPVAAVTTPPAGGTPAGGAVGAPAAAAPGADGKPTDKPTEGASDAERRLLAQVGRASKAEREAGKAVAEARAKITELEAKIAGQGTLTERAKAADELETNLKDLKGAIRLLNKHGHKFEDVVKAWGPQEEESPELAAIREETKALREAQERRDKADADAQKARQTEEARAAHESGVASAKAILEGKDPEFKDAEKRWRMASNPDDADEVVDSALASVRSHVLEKKKTNPAYNPTEEQVRGLFVKALDQAEVHLRGKAKRYAERLAVEAPAADATEEARAAVAAAAAVTPKATPGKGRVMGAPSNPLAVTTPAAEAGTESTITPAARGSLPMPQLSKPPMAGGKREMGRPIQPLGR